MWYFMKQQADGYYTNPYVCNNCGRNYKQKRNLTTHVRLECGKEGQFSCIFCPHRSKRKAHLKVHIFSKHYNEADPSTIDSININYNDNSPG